MKHFLLSLAGVTLALASLGVVEARPVAKSKGGNTATFTMNGQVVKKVQLKEGLNIVTLPDGKNVQVKMKNGKVVKESVKVLGPKIKPLFASASPAITVCFVVLGNKFCIPW